VQWTKAGILLAFWESTPMAFFAFWLLSANARFCRYRQPFDRQSHPIFQSAARPRADRVVPAAGINLGRY